MFSCLFSSFGSPRLLFLFFFRVTLFHVHPALAFLLCEDCPFSSSLFIWGNDEYRTLRGLCDAASGSQRRSPRHFQPNRSIKTSALQYAHQYNKTVGRSETSVKMSCYQQHRCMTILKMLPLQPLLAPPPCDRRAATLSCYLLLHREQAAAFLTRAQMERSLWPIGFLFLCLCFLSQLRLLLFHTSRYSAP